jgi:hypothetical protein
MQYQYVVESFITIFKFYRKISDTSLFCYEGLSFVLNRDGILSDCMVFRFFISFSA